MKTSLFSNRWWIKVSNFVQYTLRLKRIFSHWVFELIVNLAVILSVIIIFINYFVIGYYSEETQEKVHHKFDDIEEVLQWFFLAECIIKITTFGFLNFFRDNWNKLDFFLVISTFFIDVGFSALRIFTSFHMFRSIKVIKIVKF